MLFVRRNTGQVEVAGVVVVVARLFCAEFTIAVAAYLSEWRADDDDDDEPPSCKFVEEALQHIQLKAPCWRHDLLA